MGITVSNLDLSMNMPPAEDGSIGRYQAHTYNVTVTDENGTHNVKKVIHTIAEREYLYVLDSIQVKTAA